MLAPEERSLFVDALRPPQGYAFDTGIGTTFTLNLRTLLVAPLSLALHDVSKASEALEDPVLLLDGVRKYAGRLTLFCQAGYVAVPRQASPLFRYLEHMVVEVRAPNGGLFHPKLWLLRYLPEDEGPPVYRLLCLSRNVDFSRSWDVMLRLDGELQDRRVGYGRNAPLAEFLSTLPEMALRKPDDQILGTLSLLREEVRKVRFQSPPPFGEDSLEFIPLGHRSHRPYRLSTPKNRALIVSPFLTESVLQEATENGSDHMLLSEAESLRRLRPETLGRFSKVLIFNDAAISPPEDEQLEDSDPGAADPSRLHAKLYIFEKGGNARWLIGSANATSAAFSGHNVEFMIGLTGWKSRVGIDKVLGNPEEDTSLRALLAEYVPDSPEEADPEAQEAEKLLEAVRACLVEHRFMLSMHRAENGEFALMLSPSKEPAEIPARDFSVRIWPVTLREDRARKVKLDELAQGLGFDGLSILAITSFMAFEIQVNVGSATREARFVLNLPIQGAPKDRDDHIISAILTDQAQFLRYLRFLLAEELGWLPLVDAQNRRDGPSGLIGRIWDDADLPLFEELARAFSRSPEKIDQVADLIERLRATEHGREILPAGFEPLWEAIQAAREEIE